MQACTILFPGQGSQYPGMGKMIYDAYPAARSIMQEADDILNMPIKDICVSDDMAGYLSQTEYIQPAVFTLSYAMFAVLKEVYGIVPSYMLGHSLGEYSALACAGAVEFVEMLKLVRKRGLLMRETEGMMAAVFMSPIDLEVECLISKDVWVANYNSSSQSVVSGSKKNVESLCNRLEHKGIKIMPLKVNGPFHTILMKQAAMDFREELEKVNFRKPEIPVISNVLALPYESGEQICENLYNHMIMPVKWHESLKFLYREKEDLFIECGPKTVLKKLMESNLPEQIRIYAFDDPMDLSKIEKYIQEEDPEKYSRLIRLCVKTAVCTPNKNYSDGYEKDVIVPYRKLAVLGDMENVHLVHAKEAIELLFNLLSGKLLNNDEIIMIMDNLIKHTGVWELNDFVLSMRSNDV